MKVLFWLAYKLLVGNLKRAIFPFIGATIGVAALIIAFSIGAGGEKLISTNLMVMGDNRIMLGGDELSQKDMRILENYPFVEYTLFPEARVTDRNNIYIGYSERALKALGFPKLEDREVILDYTQFPDKKVGDILNIELNNNIERFRVVGLYKEENPFELMKQGNRLIISQNYFERLFNRYRFNQMIVSFDKNENSDDLIPIVLQKFNSDRRGYTSIKLLETPEVYKRVVKIQNLVRSTLYILAAISLVLSGVGIMTLISSGVRARTAHIGILRAIGMGKKDIVKVFLIEGGIISGVGTIVGVFVGIFGAILGGKLIMIPPVFNIDKIVLAILFALLVGIVMGIHPARKAGEMNITEALREN